MDPKYEFDSPFVTEDVFSGESAVQWESRASAVASESSFQSAMEFLEAPIDEEMEEPELFNEEFEGETGKRSWKTTSVQFQLWNYRGEPMMNYWVTAYIVDARTGKKVLLGKSAATEKSLTGTTGVVTYPKTVLPIEGTLILTCYVGLRQDDPLWQRRFVGSFLSGSTAWKRTQSTMIFRVSQQSEIVKVRSKRQDQVESILRKEGKVGFALGPVEAGGGGSTQKGTSAGAEKEYLFDAKVALSTLKIEEVTAGKSREFEEEDLAEFDRDEELAEAWPNSYAHEEPEDFQADEEEPELLAEDFDEEDEEADDEEIDNEEFEDLDSEGISPHHILSYTGASEPELIERQFAPGRRKKPAKSRLHQIATRHIFLHVYFPVMGTWHKGPDKGTKFLDTDFLNKFVIDEQIKQGRPNRYQRAGMELVFLNNPKSAVSDFRRSLQTPGAIVAYIGHTTTHPKTRTTMGLNPLGEDGFRKPPAIPNAELVRLLNATKAKMVILAGCATDESVPIGSVTGDTVVIATHSGPDRGTDSIQWAWALRTFLHRLARNATAGAAFDAANRTFKDISKTERFKWINGDRTLRPI